MLALIFVSRLIPYIFTYMNSEVKCLNFLNRLIKNPVIYHYTPTCFVNIYFSYSFPSKTTGNVNRPENSAGKPAE